jgi:GNAT superfamily N-acetyltransferase
MVELTRQQAAALRDWFGPERPGPLVAQHVANTGHGTCRADRWPDPRAVLATCGGNHALAGDPAALRGGGLLDGLTGFVDAPGPFAPLVRDTAGDVETWERVILALDGPPRPVRARGDHLVRRLGPADAGALAALGDETSWIGASWDGPAGLAASGTAWGAFDGARLVAVACPFFVGWRFEDLGVATEPDARGLGLSAACAAAVCADVRARGHAPSWTTSPDNTASLRVAEKLGFTHRRDDRLLVVGVPIPEPPRPPAG